jgi:hypothetical protein
MLMQHAPNMAQMVGLMMFVQSLRAAILTI